MTVGLSCGVMGVGGPPVGVAAGLKGVVMEGVPATLTSSEDELSYNESELAACMGDTSGLLGGFGAGLLGNRVDKSVKFAVVL